MEQAMNDLECPACGGDLHDLVCAGCGAKYERVLGVPFIGAYEAEDALGLIEIAANIANRDTMSFTADTVAQVETACAEYDAAADKEAFKKGHPLASEWWFSTRYQEYLSVNALVAGVPLKDKRVLDVGAGLGFDSQRLALRGADVTALEFSPILAANGQKSFPGMRWIGGFSHALPFKTGSFDAVFINAALHHMRDIPKAIAEALRVLRVGGMLITTGDPFRPNAATTQLELEVFDKHTAVLLGINEQIPRFGDFAATLCKHVGKLEAELFTTMLYGGRSGSGPNLTDRTAWDLARDLEMLAQRSGGLDMRVTLRQPLGEPRALQTAGILSPAEYVSWMNDEAHAVSRLAGLMPDEYIDRPFPGTHGKFDLLNGWRLPALTKPGVRTAYRRARWFLTRGEAPMLSFMLRSPSETDFEFRLDSAVVHRAKAGPEWSQIDIPLQRIAAGQRFVAEIKRIEANEDFEACCFDVRDRQLATPTLI
jgi:ubiquinone/menaquinone biosynthesis C-methylase UbiE